MPRLKITQAVFERARHEPSGTKDRTIYWDTTLTGFGLMVTASGHQSFIYQYRLGRLSRRMKLDGKFLRLEAERDKGKHRTLPPAASPLVAARTEAEVVRAAISQGRDPLEECRKAATAKSNTLKAIAEEYMRREGNALRSHAERLRIFKMYIYPQLGAKHIEAIKRSEVIKLLDKIQDDNGPVQADHVLAVLRRLMNWHAARADDFRSPITRGMGRTKPKERARKRTLTDNEIRALWRVCEAKPTAYTRMLQFILLTAVRIMNAAQMRRSELSADRTEWTIPASRHKSGQDFLCPLSPMAQDVLSKVPSVGRKGWVFTTGGDVPIGGFSKFKAAFDQDMLQELRKSDPRAEMERWTVHDLRRTARSLMSRAGVDTDHAERALGHVIGGVRSVYDRHEYRDEKAAAFAALALQVQRIIKRLELVAA